MFDDEVQSTLNVQ